MEMEGAVKQLSCTGLLHEDIIIYYLGEIFPFPADLHEILTFVCLFILNLFERKANLPLKVVLSVNNA